MTTLSPNEIFSISKVNLIAKNNTFKAVFLLLYICALFVVFKMQKTPKLFRKNKQNRLFGQILQNIANFGNELIHN